MKVTKIKMKQGCFNSNKAVEIDELYVADCQYPGFFKKGVLYDHLKTYPGSIYVDIYPYPKLLPAISSRGEKYVRSEPNDTPNDNLLKLPRV